MDPKKMPVRILIPIRVLAYPLPVMGICTFWYQHKYDSLDFSFKFFDWNLPVGPVKVEIVEFWME
jgi:hypothetical protein